MLQYTRKKRKAQMELMGMAIVVLLIFLGMFFAIKYTLQKPPEIKKPYMQAELAANFVNTMLLTSTGESTGEGCKPLTTMKDLLGDCAAQPEAMNKCIDGVTYCDKSKEITDKILQDSLDKWQKRYLLRVYKENPDNTYFDFPTDPVRACGANEERGKAGVFPIPSKYGTVTVRLDICG